MHSVSGRELARFNADPIAGVRHWREIDFAGHHAASQRLDVMAPDPARDGLLPVYVYFHGGGWTSGDKAPLTKYCARQAAAGVVVVNVNYRKAPRFQLGHVLQDANAALGWVRGNIERLGGDPRRVVLGGDSAGGQVAALITAAMFRPLLARHYRLAPALPPSSLRGLVQHCSVADFSVFFDPGFVLSLNFIRMLMPKDGAGERLPLRQAAHYMSPIEWLDARCPPVFITTSERDFFYSANLNLIASLKRHGVTVAQLVYGWDRSNTEHTWQQDFRFPESQEVYRRLQSFIRTVAG
jgi:acetyl esterase/lipase